MQESAIVFPTVLLCYSSSPSLVLLLTHPPILTLTFLLSQSYSPTLTLTLTLTLLKINTTQSFLFHCFFPTPSVEPILLLVLLLHMHRPFSPAHGPMGAYA